MLDRTFIEEVAKEQNTILDGKTPAIEMAKIHMLPISGVRETSPDKPVLFSFIDNWIDLKYEEVQQLRQRPHPHEFTMYYDA